MNMVLMSVNSVEDVIKILDKYFLREYNILWASVDLKVSEGTQQSRVPAPPKRSYEVEAYDGADSIHDKFSYDDRLRALEEAMRYERSGFNVRIYCITEQYDTAGKSLKPDKKIIYQSDNI